MDPTALPEIWKIRPASKQALKEWNEAEAAEPELMMAERARLLRHPMRRDDNPRRTGPLHAGLARRRIGDQTLPQWQHELTGSGIWYCPDKKTRTVWVTKVSLAHPKQTD